MLAWKYPNLFCRAANIVQPPMRVVANTAERRNTTFRAKLELANIKEGIRMAAHQTNLTKFRVGISGTA